jgi:hypothetical protein
MNIDQALSVEVGQSIFIKSFDKNLVEKVTVALFDKKNKQFLVASKQATNHFRVSVSESWLTEKESLVGLSDGFGGDINVLEKEMDNIAAQIKALKAMDAALKRRLKTIDALENIRK